MATTHTTNRTTLVTSVGVPNTYEGLPPKRKDTTRLVARERVFYLNEPYIMVILDIIQDATFIHDSMARALIETSSTHSLCLVSLLGIY